jgi:hypothetical protein
MRRTCRLMALIIVAFMLLGSTQIQTISPNAQNNKPMSAQLNILRTAGYDSPNITASLSSPENGSSVSGTFNILLDMTSDFATLNLSLFVNGTIYPGYDKANVSAGSSWVQTITVDSTTLAEGMLNFTILFEYLAEKESVYLLYFVDNNGINIEVALYTPVNGSKVSGLISVDLNITSDYNILNLTLFVDGHPLTAYNPALIGKGNVSVLVDSSSLIEGYDNFTFYFQYDFLATHDSHVLHLVYLVDNDGVPITIDHQSPANQTEVSGVFNLTLIIGSEYDPLNFTLFVENVIQFAQFNNTHIGIKEQTISINTTGLPEGSLNFTLLFEYNVTGENARVVYYLVFVVNNHLAPTIIILSPAPESTVTGLTELWLNITSTHPELYLNITVDGKITKEFNMTAISPGANNYSINTSRYENGEHTIDITAYTGEGATSSGSLHLIFLDYVRVWISGLTNYDEVSGTIQFGIRVLTPYDNVTLSLYMDNQLANEFHNRTLVPGLNPVSLNTTQFTEGNHNVTLLAYDSYGHMWKFTMILVVNNRGAPKLHFATTSAVMIGDAVFSVVVESDWDNLTVGVYVDDVILPQYNNITVDVTSGIFTFHIDMGLYSKTEHTVKVVMTTPEGDTTEIEHVYGFASIRIEEIISIAVLLGLAIIIPLYRKKNGSPLKPIMIVDAIFALVTGAAFLILGINTIPFIIWHVNLASIWAIGGTLVFTNWVYPLVIEETENE